MSKNLIALAILAAPLILIAEYGLFGGFFMAFLYVIAFPLINVPLLIIYLVAFFMSIAQIIRSLSEDKKIMEHI